MAENWLMEPTPPTKDFFQLLSTMQLPGAKGYGTHMGIHFSTSTTDFSLAQELQNACLIQHTNMELLINSNGKKQASKKNWNEREYQVQENVYVAQKYVKMSCDTNQFPSFLFFGPNTKPHGVRGLSKNYHI